MRQIFTRDMPINQTTIKGILELTVLSAKAAQKNVWDRKWRYKITFNGSCEYCFDKYNKRNCLIDLAIQVGREATGIYGFANLEGVFVWRNYGRF